MKKAAAGPLDGNQVNLRITDKSGMLGKLKDNLKERLEINSKLIEELKVTEKRILERCEQLENHQQRFSKLKEKMEDVKLKWRDEIMKLVSTGQAFMKNKGRVFEVPFLTYRTPVRPPRRAGGTRRAICFEAESWNAATITTSEESSTDVMKTPCQGTPYRSFIETPSSSYCCPSAGRGHGQSTSTTSPFSYITRSGRKVKQRTRLIEDL